MTLQHLFREERHFDSSKHVPQHRDAAKSSIASIHKMIRRADTLVSELYRKCYEGYGAGVGYQRVFS